MNLFAFLFLFAGLLPLVDRAVSAPIGNESKCSQQVMVGGEKMWITDVLANHNCQMGPLFTTAMGRGNAPNLFDKMLSSSPLTRSVCSAMVELVGVAEQKKMMDAMCSSLGKSWDLIFCKEYYPPGESTEVLKSLVSSPQSTILPSEIMSVINSLASMDQTSCYDACGGGKGFICKAFIGLAVALLNPSPAANVDEGGKTPDSTASLPRDPANTEGGLPPVPAAGNNSLPPQKIPARYGTSFGDGKSDEKSGLMSKDEEKFGFVKPSDEKENQPGPPVNPVVGNRPFPPKGFTGNGHQANSSLPRKFDPNTRRPFPSASVPAGEGQPPTGVNQPQTGFGQPQTGFGPPQTGFGQPQTGFGKPQTGFGQPQTGFGQPQTGFGQQQTSAGQPQTGFQQPQTTGSKSVPGVGRPQTNAGLPQTGVGQPRTNPGQPQTNPRQPQTNPGLPQSSVNQPQDRKPSVEAGTRTGPPNVGSIKDTGADRLPADRDKDGDKDRAKPVLESPQEDDEEHELFDKANEDDDDDYEDEKTPKEDLARPQFHNIPPGRPQAKVAPGPNKGPVTPPPPAKEKSQDNHLPDRPGKPNPRPPNFNARLHKVPPPVEIKSVGSAPLEEEYHGHGPFFFLTILCVIVLSGAMCYCCITNKMRVRETVHILLTSKGSKARREYR